MRGSYTYPKVVFPTCKFVMTHLISCVVKLFTPTMFRMTMVMLLGDNHQLIYSRLTKNYFNYGRDICRVHG